MSKHKKHKSKDATTSQETAVDPHDVLRHPASPPRPNLAALLIALALFFAWFVYLVYVAVAG
jgi:hypothetical protein